jgi:hypothetical protein
MKTFFVVLGTATMVFLPGVIVIKANAAERTKLSTDIRFDGTTLRGKRHAPFGMTATVEQDKNTPSLIDYRNNYNDRVARSKTGR